VAVLSFQSDHPNLSEYLIDDITSGLVNTDLYTVVDRRSLEILAQEMAFQLSGEVSDETALAIGRRLGAQMVISGAITYLGDFYRLRVQAIEVETARIQGSQTVAIEPNRLLATLTGNPWTGPAAPPVTAEPETTPAGPRRSSARLSVANRFYLGLRAGLSAQFYDLNPEFWDGRIDEEESYGSMELSAQMSLQLANFFALQVETVFFAADSYFVIPNYAPLSSSSSTYSVNTITLSYSAMMLPVLGKFTFRPGSFLLAVFGGIYFTIPFTAMTLDVSGTEYSYEFTPPMGLIVGGNAGIKLGPGTLFLDLRLSGDFTDTELTGDFGSRAVYRRTLAIVSLGYEFGFGRRGR
jgi:TolB-like protein